MGVSRRVLLGGLLALPLVRARADGVQSFVNGDGHTILVQHNDDGSVTVEDETAGSSPQTYDANEAGAAEQDYGLEPGTIQGGDDGQPQPDNGSPQDDGQPQDGGDQGGYPQDGGGGDSNDGGGDSSNGDDNGGGGYDGGGGGDDGGGDDSGGGGDSGGGDSGGGDSGGGDSGGSDD